MCDFLFSSELWSNIIGGIVAALVLSGVYWFINSRNRRNINMLIEIEGESIELSNQGKYKQYDDIDEWVIQAKFIQIDAIEIATKISPSAGALITWLGTKDAHIPGDTRTYWISILDKVNERIREILKAHI